MSDDRMYFRYRDHGVAVGSEEFGFSSRRDVYVMEFRVLRATAKGVWLDVYGAKRFVRHDTRKQFACPTIELARESFVARKRRQIKILSKQLEDAKDALNTVTREIESATQSLSEASAGIPSEAL